MSGAQVEYLDGTGRPTFLLLSISNRLRFSFRSNQEQHIPLSLSPPTASADRSRRAEASRSLRIPALRRPRAPASLVVLFLLLGKFASFRILSLFVGTHLIRFAHSSAPPPTTASTLSLFAAPALPRPRRSPLQPLSSSPRNGGGGGDLLPPGFTMLQWMGGSRRKVYTVSFQASAFPLCCAPTTLNLRNLA